MAEILLLLGMTAAVVFVAVLLIEGARRPGYDPTYHTGSELELGERGWVQRANFLIGTDPSPLRSADRPPS